MSKDSNHSKLRQMQTGKGKHITAEFWQCQCSQTILCDANVLHDILSNAIRRVGLTEVGYAEHTFTSQDNTFKRDGEKNGKQTSGVTLSVLLAESHLCAHTWGKEKSVTLDVYVCNFLNDNSEKASKLFEILHEVFAPTDYNVNYLSRNHLKLND